MTVHNNDEMLSDKIAFMKKHCSLCKGRSRLRSVEREQENVVTGLKNLVDFFNDQFIHLRREDADVSDINNAIDNKRLCMDLIEECNSCDKEIDYVNRALNGIRR